jgi:hypothetical protein
LGAAAAALPPPLLQLLAAVLLPLLFRLGLAMRLPLAATAAAFSPLPLLLPLLPLPVAPAVNARPTRGPSPGMVHSAQLPVASSPSSSVPIPVVTSILWCFDATLQQLEATSPNLTSTSHEFIPAQGGALRLLPPPPLL